MKLEIEKRKLSFKKISQPHLSHFNYFPKIAFLWKKKVGSRKKVSIFLILTDKEYVRI